MVFKGSSWFHTLKSQTITCSKWLTYSSIKFQFLLCYTLFLWYFWSVALVEWVVFMNSPAIEHRLACWFYSRRDSFATCDRSCFAALPPICFHIVRNETVFAYDPVYCRAINVSRQNPFVTLLTVMSKYTHNNTNFCSIGNFICNRW